MTDALGTRAPVGDDIPTPYYHIMHYINIPKDPKVFHFMKSNIDVGL